MAYPGDTSRFGDAELADLGRQGPNDFFNGLLVPAVMVVGMADARSNPIIRIVETLRRSAVLRAFSADECRLGEVDRHAQGRGLAESFLVLAGG